MTNNQKHYSPPLKEQKFSYRGGTDKTPRVLITHQNQHKVRGFNIHYLSPQQIGMVRKEWARVQNQPWSMSTKERVAMTRMDTQKISESFRCYNRKNIGRTFTSN